MSTPPKAPDDGAAWLPRSDNTPQELLLAFYGRFVLDHPSRGQVSSRVLLDVLRPLGISEAAVRAALKRMVQRDLLSREQTGRVAAFGLTSRSVDVLGEGRVRVTAEHPFTTASHQWTLLSYTVPESMRDVRHQLRSELQWAGFGRLRDGLWIAPGVVEPTRILDRIDAPDAETYVFAGELVGGTSADRFINTAWDLDRISSQHRAFALNWSDAHSDLTNPVTAMTAMGADWLRLLRADPGFPAEFLPPEWPADRSVEVYRSVIDAFEGPAEDMLDRMIASGVDRR